LAVVLQAAAITDSNGEVVDLEEIQRELIEQAAEMAGEDVSSAEALESDAEDAVAELEEVTEAEATEATEAPESESKPEA
jgi:uncharacterized membrane protein